MKIIRLQLNRAFLISGILITATLLSATTVARAKSMQAADTTEIRITIQQFHKAMSAADSAAVANILADDVRIVEGGNVETKMQYLSHHFHSDVAYLSAMKRDPQTMAISESGGMAWVTSVTRLHGTYRDREIDSKSAESLVLRKSEFGWKIVAIHWSSGR